MNPDPIQKHRSDGETSMLFIHCESFHRWLVGTTVKFPRRIRYTLTHRIENHSLDILEQISQAWFTKDAQAKLAILESVNFLNTRLRILLRQAYYQKVLSPRRFEYAMTQVQTTGKMLGGWIKDAAERKGKQT